MKLKRLKKVISRYINIQAWNETDSETLYYGCIENMPDTWDGCEVKNVKIGGYWDVPTSERILFISIYKGKE